MKECHQVRGARTNRDGVARDDAGGIGRSTGRLSPRSLRWRIRSTASVMALLLATACATLPAPLGSDRIAALLADPARTQADRNNDARRKPDQMLAFIGIRPGITALDVSAAGGYTTELLARSIGPAGKVYGDRKSTRLNSSH